MGTTTFLWRNLLKCLPSSTSSNSFLVSQPDPFPPPSSSTAAATVMFNTNYNSLYDDVSSSLAASTSTFFSTATAPSSSESDSSDVDVDSLPPDFATVLASPRFFFSSPGRSNSISDSYNNKVDHAPPLEGGVAVNKYSPDPYTDFKKSMEEMIDAHRRRIKDDDGARADDEEDWDYLNQLLTCYLTLNPEHAHKYIISAFADIVVLLLSESDKSPPDSESLAGGRKVHLS